jgi:hypothetical protein
MSWEELEVLGWGSWYDCDCECGGFASEVGGERGVHGVENVRLRMGILPMTCSLPNSAPSTRRAATGVPFTGFYHTSGRIAGACYAEYRVQT